MKKVILLLLLVYVLGFVFADINFDDDDYYVDNLTSTNDLISGEINLMIESEPYDSLIIAEDGQNISLIDFLEYNSVDSDDYCFPSDCETGYSVSSSDVSGNFLDVSYGDDMYLGFLVEGGEVSSFGSISFELSSDFLESTVEPLSVEFCEEEIFTFEDFSETLRDAESGCYDSGNWEGVGTNFKIGPIPYCERIYIPKTEKVWVNASVYCTETYGVESEESAIYEDVVMLLSKDGTDYGDCVYNASHSLLSDTERGTNVKKETGCWIDSDDYFDAGYYDVCIGTEELSTYFIYHEDKGYTCGFTEGEDYTESTVDYGIYAAAVMYANYSVLGDVFSDAVDFEDLVDIANNYIDDRYDSDCSDGCVLPMKISGVDQKLQILNVDYYYMIKNLGYRQPEEVFEIEAEDPVINYEGTLDLGLLGFYPGWAGTFEIYFGENEETLTIDLDDIDVAPVVESLTPEIAPAGIPITLNVEVDYNGTGSLTYYWSIEDNEEVTTYVPSLEYTFEDYGDASVNIRVEVGSNLTGENEFEIEVVSPEAAINSTLTYKLNSLSSVQSILDSISDWYKSALTDILNIDVTQDKLNVFKSTLNVVEDEDEIIELAKEVYALDGPASIVVIEKEFPYIINDLNDVSIYPIIKASGISASGDDDDYSSAILNWQNTNIQAGLTKKSYSFEFFSGEKVSPLISYSFDVKSMTSESGYFVFDIPTDAITFRSNYNQVDADGYTVIPISGNYDNTIDFYTRSDYDVTYFFSPSLSSVVIESEIDGSCNYNLVCEPVYGEDSDSCRLDCMPVGKMITLIVLILLGFVAGYSLLSLWYNKKYERYLFPDSRELYNMLMFVANARTRGMKEGQIAGSLKKTGWPGEKVSFIMKKSQGKRVGLPEIIPVSKISAKIVENRARKAQEAELKKAQEGQEQNGSAPMGRGLPPPLDPGYRRY